MAKEQRIPKSMSPERLKLLYTNIPDNGLLAWATLKKLGFSNQIDTLLNNGIIKREERGRYTLLKTTDILKLLTDGESVAVVFYKLYVDLLNKRGDKIPSIILQKIQAMQNNNKLMLSKHILSS